MVKLIGLNFNLLEVDSLWGTVSSFLTTACQSYSKTVSIKRDIAKGNSMIYKLFIWFSIPIIGAIIILFVLSPGMLTACFQSKRFSIQSSVLK